MLLNPARAFGAPDEDAALAHSEFTKPIVLHIDRDGFSEAQRLKSLNGVSNFGPGDLNQAGGLNDFPPCADQVGNDSAPGINAYVVGYNLDPRAIQTWLFDNRFIQLETYDLRYPKFASKVAAIFRCPILNNNVGKYLPSDQARNVHNGLDIAIGRRVLTKWTYRNRYDTPAPGKGNVKVFAGTFTYRIDPIVPIVSFSGEGTAKVKMFLDPDTGRWSADNWEKQGDPRITLLTKPLESAPVATPTPATPAPADWYEVDAGRCRLLVFKLSYLKNPNGKRTWSGACENGYANGLGIARNYDTSGSLIGIFQAEMARGRPKIIESYVRHETGQVEKIRDGNGVWATSSNVADWAREILAK